MARGVQVSAGAAYDLGYHIVWCPKYRRPVLTGPVAVRCDGLVRARCAGHGWQVVALEVLPDHVLLFSKAQSEDSPVYVANQVEGFSSRVLRAEFPRLRSRLPTLWSGSYFAAIVGVVSAVTVRRCIGIQYERAWRKRGPW